MKMVFTEYNLSSFEDFHDKEWFSKTYALVKGTEIESIVEEFAAHWYGNARAFVLPWLLINGVYDGINSVAPLPSSPQDLWNEYLKNEGFHAAIWKLAENTYCSVYYAYENLIVNLLIQILKTKTRITDKDFNSKLIDVYGNQLANNLWASSFITMVREVRNCIVHNGGKASSKLLGMKLCPQINEGNIMISASDARYLYIWLKPLVSELITKSLAIIEMKQR